VLGLVVDVITNAPLTSGVVSAVTIKYLPEEGFCRKLDITEDIYTQGKQNFIGLII
jgi:hypothetical protein